MTHRLPPCESLTVEFKSDRRRLSDTDLVEAIVCLANGEGGELWLGVEDDGTPTGLHAEHFSLDGLSGLVAARTSPSLAVTVEGFSIGEARVAKIAVPKSSQEVATSGGVYLRRRLRYDGTPECAPMLPHERISRASSFGLLDVSARPVAGATLADLDPLERERLRQSVERYRDDKVLLELGDEDLDGVLGLTQRQADGSRLPTLTGLLLIGKESSLWQLVPTHEVAFQVLAQEAVKLNEFRRYPLLKALDWLETNFRPYNPEDEIRIGMFRVPVPMVDMDAFREAVANALLHRDYHRLGAVHVRLENEALVVSNPGGLVEGVTLANLLTTEPRPRYLGLVDAMKRIGVVERSGRGVDTIYRGMLRFGRALPDYSRTDAHSVVLVLPTGAADLEFLKLVVEEENKQRGKLPVDSLIALSTLREMKRVTANELASRIQRDGASAKRTLEALIERGLVERHGSGRNTSYTLSVSLYQAAGDKVAYTRQAAFTALQHEQMVLNYARQHGGIKRADVVELCHLSEDQATRFLKKLTDSELLQRHGQKRGSFYTLIEQTSV